METRKSLLLLIAGVLAIIVFVIFVNVQLMDQWTQPYEEPVSQQPADTPSQYQGVVVSLTAERDLLHILEAERGLTAIRIPADMRDELASLDDGDTIVLIGVADGVQNPGFLRLQSVVSIEAGELTPEQNVQLNQEFRDLRL